MERKIKRLLRSLRFNFRYIGNPPWDTGIPVPELVDFISNHKPGRALDLGCGTGINMTTFLNAGWKVVGVDIAALAIIRARRKVNSFGAAARVFFGSVVDLDFLTGK
jgi:methylase of polypeptide subunit release factors